MSMSFRKALDPCHATSPAHYTFQLARYMSDPSAIRAAARNHYGPTRRLPDCETIREQIAAHRAANKPKELRLNKRESMSLEPGMLEHSQEVARKHHAKASRRLLASLWRCHPEILSRLTNQRPAPEPVAPPPAIKFEAPAIAPDIVHLIVREVADDLKITRDDIFGPRKFDRFVAARYVLVTILRERGWSYPQMGKMLGRDHSSIVHLAKFGDKYRRKYPQIESTLSRLSLMRTRPGSLGETECGQ